MSATQSSNINISSGSTLTVNGLSQSINNTSLTINNGTIYTNGSINRHILYNILGAEFKSEYHHLSYNDDLYLRNIIATLNILGEPYWIELKKQGVILHDGDMEKFIEERLMQLRRENIIDKIVGTN